jgi:hypothetical protein
MSPNAEAIVLTDLPGRVIDFATAPAEFDFEPGGRPRIEGEHAVVGMHAERVGDRHACIERAIVGVPDVLHGTDLEHEVMDALRQRCRREGHGVVARVGVQKGNAEGEPRCQLGFNPIGKPHAEQFAIEPLGGLRVHRPKDNVAEALIASDKSGRHSSAPRAAPIAGTAMQNEKMQPKGKRKIAPVFTA